MCPSSGLAPLNADEPSRSPEGKATLAGNAPRAHRLRAGLGAARRRSAFSCARSGASDTET